MLKRQFPPGSIELALGKAFSQQQNLLATMATLVSFILYLLSPRKHPSLRPLIQLSPPAPFFLPYAISCRPGLSPGKQWAFTSGGSCCRTLPTSSLLSSRGRVTRHFPEEEGGRLWHDGAQERCSDFLAESRLPAGSAASELPHAGLALESSACPVSPCRWA